MARAQMKSQLMSRLRLCFSVAEQTDRTDAEQQESRWFRCDDRSKSHCRHRKERQWPASSRDVAELPKKKGVILYYRPDGRSQSIVNQFILLKKSDPIVKPVFTKTASGKKELLESHFIDKLAELCQGHILRVATDRTTTASLIRLAIGPATDRAKPKDFGEMRQAIERWATDESPRATNYVQSVVEIFDTEHARCEAAVNTKDVDAMLALFPGKELLRPLAHYAGFSDTTRLLTSVTENLTPDEFAPLVEIRDAARAKLA
jgi:hypothetical protein